MQHFKLPLLLRPCQIFSRSSSMPWTICEFSATMSNPFQKYMNSWNSTSDHSWTRNLIASAYVVSEHQRLLGDEPVRLFGAVLLQRNGFSSNSMPQTVNLPERNLVYFSRISTESKVTSSTEALNRHPWNSHRAYWSNNKRIWAGINHYFFKWRDPLCGQGGTRTMNRFGAHTTSTASSDDARSTLLSFTLSRVYRNRMKR